MAFNTRIGVPAESKSRSLAHDMAMRKCGLKEPSFTSLYKMELAAYQYVDKMKNGELSNSYTRLHDLGISDKDIMQATAYILGQYAKLAAEVATGGVSAAQKHKDVLGDTIDPRELEAIDKLNKYAHDNGNNAVKDVGAEASYEYLTAVFNMFPLLMAAGTEENGMILVDVRTKDNEEVTENAAGTGTETLGDQSTEGEQDVPSSDGSVDSDRQGDEGTASGTGGSEGDN